jgi:hypothetical protein
MSFAELVNGVCWISWRPLEQTISRNFEVGCFLESGPLNARLAELCNETAARCTEVVARDYAGQPWLTRVWTPACICSVRCCEPARQNRMQYHITAKYDCTCVHGGHFKA